MNGSIIKVIAYLEKNGIDFKDTSHPLVKEYSNVKILDNPMLLQAFEHLLMILVVDLEIIKKHDPTSYNYYLSKLCVNELSFWGERFEIYYYSKLIQHSKLKSLRRGKSGGEADFIGDYESSMICIETTTINYSANSEMSNPISKILKVINRKDKKTYANCNCCLVIDISNLLFYRKIINNFKTTISSVIDTLESQFGAILFFYSYHDSTKGNLHYISKAYTWLNISANPALAKYISESTIEVDDGDTNIYFNRM